MSSIHGELNVTFPKTHTGYLIEYFDLIEKIIGIT